MAAICPSCGRGRLWPRDTGEELLGIDLGTYPALVCDTCGETYLDANAMTRLEARAKELGIWGFLQSTIHEADGSFPRGSSTARSHEA